VEQLEIPSEAMKQMINSHGYLPNWPYREDLNPFLSHISGGWRVKQNRVQTETDDDDDDDDDETSSDSDSSGTCQEMILSIH